MELVLDASPLVQPGVELYEDLTLKLQNKMTRYFVQKARRARLFSHFRWVNFVCKIKRKVGQISAQFNSYGWFIADEQSRRYIYHWARIDGFISSNGFFPDEQVVVIVLSNLETSNVFQSALHAGVLAINAAKH